MIDFDNLPKISCLMVAGPDRLEYLRRSVRCYLDQTYPNLELIILNDSSTAYQSQLSQYVDSLDRDDIRLVFLKNHYRLGSLRNISLAVMTGEVFCQWDDDDFNFPTRISTQYRFLKNSGRPVSYLSDQLHYYFQTKELFWEDWRAFHSSGKTQFSVIPGTAMGYRRGLKARYSPESLGEDSVLSDRLCELDQVAYLSGKGHLHVYGYHGQNAYDYDHHRLLSLVRSHACEFMKAHRREIVESLDYLKFDGPIRVMGREGLGFLYDP